MQTAPRPLDVTTPEEIVSLRHRPAVVERFPSSGDSGYDAREAAYLRSLLVEPLRQVARESTDERTRMIADGALGHGSSDDVFIDYTRLEEALGRIVATTADEAARYVAGDALALYQGR